MQKALHPGPVFCSLCGCTIPGPAKHFADRIHGAWAFYCKRCALITAGKRKVKPADRERIDGHLNRDRPTEPLPVSVEEE